MERQEHTRPHTSKGKRLRFRKFGEDDDESEKHEIDDKDQSAESTEKILPKLQDGTGEAEQKETKNSQKTQELEEGTREKPENVPEPKPKAKEGDERETSERLSLTPGPADDTEVPTELHISELEEKMVDLNHRIKERVAKLEGRIRVQHLSMYIKRLQAELAHLVELELKKMCVR